MDGDSIQSITEYFLTQDGHTHAKLFLIYKTTHQNVTEKFHATVVNIEDELKPAFDNMTVQVLKDIRKNYSKIISFSAKKLTDKYVKIKKTTLPELEGLLGELELHQEPPSVPSFQQMDRYNHNIYCFHYKTLDKRIFMFSKIEKYVFPENTQYIVGEFRGKKLKLKTDEIVILSTDVFCIYYEDIQTLLITKYSDTKKLLGLNKMFRNNCAKILKDKLKDVFSFDDADLKKITKASSTNEFLLKIHDRIPSRIDPSYYKKWNEIYEKKPVTHKRLSELQLTRNGTPILKNSKDLETVLRIIHNDIMQGVMNPVELAVVYSKDTL